MHFLEMRRIPTPKMHEKYLQNYLKSFFRPKFISANFNFFGALFSVFCCFYSAPIRITPPKLATWLKNVTFPDRKTADEHGRHIRHFPCNNFTIHVSLFLW